MLYFFIDRRYYMKILYPDYEKSLVNFSATILKEFGIDSPYTTFRRINKLFREEKYTNVVVLVYDGLGTKIMDKHLDKNSFLFSHRMTDITSVAPSSTVATTTSLLSTKTPYEHGLLGLNLYFKDLNELVNVSNGYVKNSSKEVDRKMLNKHLEYQSIIDKINDTSEARAYGIFPTGTGSYESRDEAYSRIINLSKNSGKKLIYAYFDEPGCFMYKYGTDCDSVHKEILRIDEEIKELCDKLQDSVIFVTADHGYVNSEAIILKDYKDIYSLIDRTLDIETRCTGIKVKTGKSEEFREKFKEKFGKYFLLMNYNEIVEKKLFGMGIEQEYFKEYIGDFVAFAIDKYALNYDDCSPMFKADSAGLTEKEMLVPISIVLKKPFKDGIRRAVAEDYKEIRQMCNDIQKFRAEKRKDIFMRTDTLSFPDFNNYCNKNSPDVCFVYTIEDKVVGFIKMRLNTICGEKLYRNFSYLEIENFFVKKEYRKQGIGTALGNYVISYAKKKRVKKIEFCAWNFEEETCKFVEKFNPTELIKVLEIDLS